MILGACVWALFTLYRIVVWDFPQLQEKFIEKNESVEFGGLPDLIFGLADLVEVLLIVIQGIAGFLAVKRNSSNAVGSLIRLTVCFVII